MIFITHKLREIMHITDRVSVMRRGEMVLTTDTAATSPAAARRRHGGPPRAAHRRQGAGPARAGAARGARPHGARRQRRAAGRRRVLHAARRRDHRHRRAWRATASPNCSKRWPACGRSPRGEILIDGEACRDRDAQPRRRCGALGLVHIPEDRHRMGLVTAFEASESAILGIHRDPAYGAGPFLSRRKVIGRPGAQDGRLRHPPAGAAAEDRQFLRRQPAEDRAGPRDGARSRHRAGGQPTRGVDIGAIEFIHKRLVALRDAGKAVLVVSVELDEILALADQILVMCGGRITGERTPPPGRRQRRRLRERPRPADGRRDGAAPPDGPAHHPDHARRRSVADSRAFYERARLAGLGREPGRRRLLPARPACVLALFGRADLAADAQVRRHASPASPA